jgi:hypothetical protein
VIESELIFRGLKTILDCPPMAFDLHQYFDRCCRWAPAGRSKSPGYGHLKLPHLMTTGRAAELRPVKQDVYFRSLQPRRGWGVERLEATAAKHSIYVT